MGLGTRIVLSSIHSSIHRSEARFVARFKGPKFDSQTFSSVAYYNISESFLYSPCIHENKTRLIPQNNIMMTHPNPVVIHGLCGMIVE